MADAIFKVYMYNNPHLLKKKHCKVIHYLNCVVTYFIYRNKEIILFFFYFFFAQNKQSFLYFVTYRLTLYVVFRYSGDRMLHNVSIIYMYTHTSFTQKGIMLCSLQPCHVTYMLTSNRTKIKMFPLDGYLPYCYHPTSVSSAQPYVRVLTSY